MKIHVETVWAWSEESKQYTKISDKSYDYCGEVGLACGASPEQEEVQNAQMGYMGQAAAQSSAIFGADSQVYNSLMATFAPIVAAGASQEGFSPAEKANLNSEAITETGQSYKNAKEAVGEAQSSVGGGNTSLPSGTQTGEDLQLAESGANQTASELGQITQADYQTGRQNYQQAVQGELAAPNVFNGSTAATNAVTNSSTAAGNTANQIAQQNNSWAQAVTGALGGIAGAAIGKIPSSSSSSSSSSSGGGGGGGGSSSGGGGSVADTGGYGDE